MTGSWKRPAGPAWRSVPVVAVLGRGPGHADREHAQLLHAGRVTHEAGSFEGLAVHCAQGSAACSAAHGGRPDVLPGEPGGYSVYHALYGNEFVQPLISPGGPVRNLDGAVIKDSSGGAGFPGYDAMTGANALAYTLTCSGTASR